MAALAFCLRSPDAFAGKGIPSWPWSQPGLSLLQRLGTTDLATWDRRGVLAQPESGGVIVFPRIGLYIPSGRAAGGNPVQSPEKQAESCQGVPGAAAGQLTAALLAGTRSRMAEMAQVTWPFFSLLLQMEKKPQDIKTLPHCGVRQAERIQLPALPPLPRQAATQAAAPKQVPKAETSSSEKATCKLPPLQAAASATSARGRAKALGTEALSHRELLPPLPCVSAERDRAERAERWERVPHSPVAPAEDVEYSVRSFVSTVIRNAVAKSKARLSPSGRGPRTTGHRTPPLPTAVPWHLKKSRHPPHTAHRLFYGAAGHSTVCCV
eukprot:XP_027303270.1 uncharacterized protein LOC113840726 [Anas platyrhynchos]